MCSQYLSVLFSCSEISNRSFMQTRLKKVPNILKISKPKLETPIFCFDSEIFVYFFAFELILYHFVSQLQFSMSISMTKKNIKNIQNSFISNMHFIFYLSATHMSPCTFFENICFVLLYFRLKNIFIELITNSNNLLSLNNRFAVRRIILNCLLCVEQRINYKWKIVSII